MKQRQRVRSSFRRLTKRSKYLPQTIATTITVAIITIIILAPSALGIIVTIQGLSENQQLGTSGSFTFLAKVQIDSNEFVPLDHLEILLDGTSYSFNPSTGATIGSVSDAITSVMPVNFGSGNLFTSTYGFTSSGTYAVNSYSYGWKYGTPPNYTGPGIQGPQTFVWNITLAQENLSEGDHTIRIDVITTSLTLNTYSSSTVTFEIVAGTSETVSIPTTSTTATIDNTATTNTTVVLTGITYIDSSIPATITTIIFDTAPTTPTTVAAGTSKTPAKYVDVKAFNMAGGTATITISYTDAEVAGLDESALTLYYYNNSTDTWVEFSNIVRNLSANTISGDVDVTNLAGTYVSLAGSAPAAAPAVTPPAAGPGPGLPVVSATVNTNLRVISLSVVPGSTTTISLTLRSTDLFTSGNIQLTLPDNLVFGNLRTFDFMGTTNLTGNQLLIEKTSSTGTTAASIFFTLTIPLNSSIEVGQVYTVTIDEMNISGATVNFQTGQTVTFSIVKPSVNIIYNALDSYFTQISSRYTENRIPTTTDIMNLLDFRLTGTVEP